MTKKLQLLSIAALGCQFALVAPALAGKERGGGDAVLSQDGHQAVLLDLIEPLEHKYFSPFREGLSLDRFTMPGRFSAAMYYIGGWGDTGAHGATTPQEQQAAFIADYLRITLGYGLRTDENWHVPAPETLVWIFTDTPLEEIQDEGAIRLDEPASKVQVALQNNGVVVVHEPTFRKMDVDSRVGLFLHESILRLMLVANPSLIREQGTAPVRRAVKLAMNYTVNSAYVPVKLLNGAGAALKLPRLAD